MARRARLPSRADERPTLGPRRQLGGDARALLVFEPPEHLEHADDQRGCHGPVGAVVDLKFISFVPQQVTVHVGQAVEWKFEDDPVAHNVTFTGFASPTEAAGTFFHTFEQPGTFHYRCTIHVNMTGTVVVLP